MNKCPVVCAVLLRLCYLMKMIAFVVTSSFSHHGAFFFFIEQEESVAEMGYMTEASNVSVKVLPPADPGIPFMSNVTNYSTGGSSVGDVNTSARKAAGSSRQTADAHAFDTIKTGASDSDTKPYAVDPSSSEWEEEHRPLTLPKFSNTQMCMWTSSHAANCPSEDRSASLVNLLLQPLPPDYDVETQLPALEPDYNTLIRVNLWAVIDGHGGGSVATYASEVLLPHIAASVSRALGCAIVDRGVCTVNGQLRDANAVDLDGLIRTSDQSLDNPNSIHYQSPYERNDCNVTDLEGNDQVHLSEIDEGKPMSSLMDARSSNADSSVADASASSVKTSVKTTTSPANPEAALPGTHSPREVANITEAITESFLAVDEGWINSIDPVATLQTSCQSNGRWNSGACALVVFTIQRLDWTGVSEPDREKDAKGPNKTRRNTSQNRDAARLRMLDYASRAKSASSMSTVSSASGLESEITETDFEEERSLDADDRKRNPLRSCTHQAHHEKESLISPPGGCSCHCYRAHDAILYTAHVGDCRAVMLGSAPPRTIKVRDHGDTSHQDTTDDESTGSHHSSDETECLSSSDHDADSSEEEYIEPEASTASTASSSYLNFPRRVARQKSARRRAADDLTAGPYIALPPLEKEESSKAVEFEFETDIDRRERYRIAGKDPSDSSASSVDSDDILPLVHLPPVTRPIDLTTDHSAYNPAEVTAVLRRCNNAPRAISAGLGGGIKRVAGSLAVTRALGDAYLKTPLLSFLPYKRHAPYITARPEVNCRPLAKDGDKVLILATDGVWERASGEDSLRWVRNFYDERVAEAERRTNRRMNTLDKSSLNELNEEEEIDDVKNSQETAERDLFERSEPEVSQNKLKRELVDIARSPSPPAKRRKRGRHSRISYNVADVIVRRVLNKVRRARNISSLQALMTLPQGRARRSKHDDITASVVDLSAFVS
jgi:serine/threonine protein phosphatase PrpC